MRRHLVTILGPVSLALFALSRASGAQPARDSPVAYGHVATLGQTGVPWQRTNAYLNQPWGIDGDRDGVWVANGGGRNLLRFGPGAAEELGRAGDLEALYGRPVRFLADVAVAVHEVVPPGGSDRPRRTVWFADQDGHVAVGIPLDHSGHPGEPVVIGEADVPGDGPQHLRGPSGIAVAAEGAVFVSDTGNQRVQVFSPTGAHVATIGRTGVAGGGPGQLDRPARIALARDGRLYIADSGNHRVVAYDVRDPAAPVETQVYGRTGEAGSANDRLDTPLGVFADATFLYVADSGNGRVQILGWRDGKHQRALGGQWDGVSDVTQDARGNLYAALPRQMQVLGFDAATLDPRPDLSFGLAGAPYATRDELHNAPRGVAVAADGSVAVVEGEGHRIVRYRTDGTPAWTAGLAGVAGAGAAGAIRFDGPADAAFLPDGRLVVADTGNRRLVVLDATGRLAAVWGAGALQSPGGLAALPGGGLAVADATAGRVRLLDGSGAVTGDLTGPGGPVVFSAPADIAADAAGKWYVSEPSTHAVRFLDGVGRLVRTIGVAGSPGDDFAHLRQPTGLAIDGEGRLLVVDTGNDRVQVFRPDGTYATTIGGRRGGGTGGFVEPRGVALAPDGRVLVADAFNHRVQVFALAAEPWLPAAVNGFGDRVASAVEAQAEFDGRLYAGLRTGAGAAIWRRDGNGPWEQAAAGGFGDATNQAVTALAAYGNHLFAGIENLVEAPDVSTDFVRESSTGGGVWRSTDGRAWEPVASNGLGDRRQSGLGPFAAFGGHLYVGSRTIDRASPPKLWRSSSGGAGTWQPVGLELAARGEWPKVGAISALAVYSSSLYVGTCAEDGAQVWASADGAAWHAVGFADAQAATPQLGAGAPCITSYAEHDGHLYAALGSEERMAARLGVLTGTVPGRATGLTRASPAVELWRCAACDGTDWDAAAAPGFGSRESRGAMSLHAFDEPPFRNLYAIAGNAMASLEVWRAPDGLDWEPVTAGGFGDDNNTDPGGVASALVYRGRLHVGTVNRANGGELWSTGGTRPGAVPTRPGPTATPTPRPQPQPPTGRARYRKVGAWPLAAAGQPDELRQPLDMAISAEGGAYILDGGPSRVLHLLPDGTWASPFGGLGGGPERITQPGAIALDDSAGRVYVSDVGTRRLVAFDRQGGYLRTVLHDVTVRHIVVRPDGSLWLADATSGAVRRVTPDGAEEERFGRYSALGDDGFVGLAGVAEEPGGRLWIADRDGQRLRAYERVPAGGWTLVRTVDTTSGALAGCNGRRLQALRDDVILAGECIVEAGGPPRRLPADHRGSDLYGVDLRTARPGPGLYFAVATYDLSRDDTTNETSPAVVRYADEGFDIVMGAWFGRGEAASATADNALDGPFRLDVLPGGDLVVSDVVARRDDACNPGFFRRFSPDGRPIENLAVRSYPSQSYELMLDADLVAATGAPGQVMGVGTLVMGSPRQPLRLEAMILGRTVMRRTCRCGGCSYHAYVEPIWQTTLLNLNQPRGARPYNYASTFEHTKRQLVLLQLWADNPSDVAQPARLFLFAADGRGRKTEILLDGTEREALWTDVDAGPDGHIYVLDTLNDLVLALDADGNRLRTIDTPKDAWKVAGGPGGEVFVLTTYGYVVRLAADGTVLSRFVGLPNDIVPPTALTDLGVDAWGRVYTIDDLYDQVSIFEPEGTEDDVLQGARCGLGGDKWVAPTEILLGDTAQLHMTLFGTCGFVEDPADIVLMVNAKFAETGPAMLQETINLRVARQIFSVVDLDRHRVGIGSYVLSGNVDQPLTQDRDKLIRALLDVPTSRTTPGCGLSNTEVALRTARDMFADSPPDRRKLLVLVQPDREPAKRPPYCPWTAERVGRVADQLAAAGIVILSVNGDTVACTSDTTCNIPVAPRGQGVGRPAVHVALARQWPPSLVRTGTLVDQLPANIDYVAGSANPPAAWDPVRRTLTWALTNLPLGGIPRFTLTIRPRQEGLWPTNTRAAADVVDGWGQAQRVVLPVPKIRVYGELPPTPTFTPTITPTPVRTPTPEPSPTSRPGRIYLPILLKTEPCQPDTRSADVALVIDTSGSMSAVTSAGGPSKLDAAREAARQFVGRMSAGRDQAAVIQFNSEVVVLQPLSADLAGASAALDRLTQATGTRIDMALDAARAELTGPARRQGNNPVLILLTDGAPTGTTPDEVRIAALLAKNAGILVFTIGLGLDVDSGLLRDVAGRADWYFLAPDTSDLQAIYDRIAYEIPCQPMWPPPLTR